MFRQYPPSKSEVIKSAGLTRTGVLQRSEDVSGQIIEASQNSRTLRIAYGLSRLLMTKLGLLLIAFICISTAVSLSPKSTTDIESARPSAFIYWLMWPIIEAKLANAEVEARVAQQVTMARNMGAAEAEVWKQEQMNFLEFEQAERLLEVSVRKELEEGQVRVALQNCNAEYTTMLQAADRVTSLDRGIASIIGGLGNAAGSLFRSDGLKRSSRNYQYDVLMHNEQMKSTITPLSECVNRHLPEEISDLQNAYSAHQDPSL